MPTVSGVRMGFRVLAVVVAGALTLPPAFGEDAGSSRAGDDALRQHSNEDAAGGNAAKSDQPAPRDDRNTIPEGQRLPDPGATSHDERTPQDIDTRNDVLPRRPNPKSHAVGDLNAKPESPAMKNLHRRVFPPQTTPHPVVRNSIGVPIPPREGGERRDREHFDILGVPHGPVLETPGVTGNSTGHFSKTEQHFYRPVPNTPPGVRPITLNHAAINGTGVVRRGSGPPQIGGPTTATSGINGTTIRSPH